MLRYRSCRAYVQTDRPQRLSAWRQRGQTRLGQAGGALRTPPSSQRCFVCSPNVKELRPFVLPGALDLLASSSMGAFACPVDRVPTRGSRTMRFSGRRRSVNCEKGLDLLEERVRRGRHSRHLRCPPPLRTRRHAAQGARLLLLQRRGSEATSRCWTRPCDLVGSSWWHAP